MLSSVAIGRPVLVVTENVALRKPSLQSSTDGIHAASRAVDGSLSTSSCTEKSSVQPWWSVDLGIPMDVGGVTVVVHDKKSLG